MCVCPGPVSPVPVKLGRGVTTRRAGRTLPWDLLARFRAPRWGLSAAPAGEPPARSLQLFSIWARVRQPLFPPRAAELGRRGGLGSGARAFREGSQEAEMRLACLPSASPTLSGVDLAETGEGAPPPPAILVPLHSLLRSLGKEGSGVWAGWEPPTSLSQVVLLSGRLSLCPLKQYIVDGLGEGAVGGSCVPFSVPSPLFEVL